MMDKIIYTAISQDSNKAYLNKVPHRSLAGMVLVYRFVNSSGKCSAVITNEKAFELGFTEEQLYDMAVKNVSHYLPVLREVKEGVFEITAAESGAIGMAKALSNGLLNGVLGRTKSSRVFVALGTDKATLGTDLIEVAKRASLGVQIFSYDRRNGLAVI